MSLHRPQAEHLGSRLCSGDGGSCLLAWSVRWPRSCGLSPGAPSRERWKTPIKAPWERRDTLPDLTRPSTGLRPWGQLLRRKWEKRVRVASPRLRSLPRPCPGRVRAGHRHPVRSWPGAAGLPGVCARTGVSGCDSRCPAVIAPHCPLDVPEMSACHPGRAEPRFSHPAGPRFARASSRRGRVAIPGRTHSPEVPQRLSISFLKSLPAAVQMEDF